MLTLYSYPTRRSASPTTTATASKVFAFLRARRRAVPARAHFRRVGGAARPIALSSSTRARRSATATPSSPTSLAKHRLTIDAGLTGAQRDTDHLVTRMLDDLYWVMSYSRWKDERFWPLFRAALLRERTPEPDRSGAKQGAAEFNFQRYHFQGIGRYAPDAAYARGLADLQVLANLIPASGYVHGEQADQHRCRHLWIHRQHLFLRDRDSAPAIRRVARQYRASLSRHP